MNSSEPQKEDVMIEISFSAPRRRGGALEWNRVAILRVDGTHFTVDGDEDFAEVRDIEVLDVESGQSVTYDADPERWARNLPYAFRSGDLVCQVVGDEASEAAARQAMAARA